MANLPPKMRAPQAASYLGISGSTLAKMRLRGDGPPYAKLIRTVIYDRSDLDDWLSERTHRSTSEYLPATSP